MLQANSVNKLTVEEIKIKVFPPAQQIFFCNGIKNISLDYRYNFGYLIPNIMKQIARIKVNYIVLAYKKHS